MWSSVWQVTQVLYASIQYNYKVCEGVYYYYTSEVTAGTADKLLSGKCSMPCVVDVVDFVLIVDIL